MGLLKSWALPIAIACGAVCYPWASKLEFLVPYLLFAMLTIAYTRIGFHDLKLNALQWTLMAVQLAGCWTVYFALYHFNAIVAEGAFLCVFIPTAAAAPVITGMLGGSIPKLASFSLLCNLMVAFMAPVFLPWVDTSASADFWASFIKICEKVVPILVLPLIIAFVLKRSVPKAHEAIAKHQLVSFWLWAITLFVNIGNATSFVIAEPKRNIPTMIMLAIVSLIVCVLQFYAGRKIGNRLGDRISGAQGLGQKNTALGMWLALTYLNPIVSIAPAAYIIWQNIINSAQIYFKEKGANI